MNHTISSYRDNDADIRYDFRDALNGLYMFV